MKKYKLGNETDRKSVSQEKCKEYITKLSKMIDCKTVWTADGKYSDEFDRFYNVVEQNFPNVAARAKKLIFGQGCFVYVIEGKNATKNIMLMSHHDVVEGGDGWETDPFVATEREGYLWGRGTIDTKTPLFA